MTETSTHDGHQRAPIPGTTRENLNKLLKVVLVDTGSCSDMSEAEKDASSGEIHVTSFSIGDERGSFSATLCEGYYPNHAIDRMEGQGSPVTFQKVADLENRGIPTLILKYGDPRDLRGCVALAKRLDATGVVFGLDFMNSRVRADDIERICAELREDCSENVYLPEL